MADTFRKDDKGKPRVDLIPPAFTLAVADVLTHGADKYGPTNYLNGAEWGRYYAATQRHLLAFWGGEDTDPESGRCHLAHAAANLALLSDLKARGVGVDRRQRAPLPATAAYADHTADDSAEARALMRAMGVLRDWGTTADPETPEPESYVAQWVALFPFKAADIAQLYEHLNGGGIAATVTAAEIETALCGAGWSKATGYPPTALHRPWLSPAFLTPTQPTYSCIGDELSKTRRLLNQARADAVTAPLAARGLLHWFITAATTAQIVELVNRTHPAAKITSDTVAAQMHDAGWPQRTLCRGDLAPIKLWIRPKARDCSLTRVKSFRGETQRILDETKPATDPKPQNAR